MCSFRSRFGMSPWFIFLALFAVSSVAVAQDEIDFASMDLEDLLNVEVTVASKSKETVADAPSSVTVFSRQEIQNMGITTLQELLNYVPGFQTARQQEIGTWYDAVSSRGRRTDPGAPEIMFLIDGQRLNDYWRGVAGPYNNNMTLSNIKQVEIIRGPGSALYGSNAFLGVVNIVTDNSRNEAGGSFGSWNRREIYANVSQEVEGMTLAVSASGFADEGDYYDQMPLWNGLDRPTNDPIEGFDGYVSLSGEKFRINLRHTQRHQEDFRQFGNVSNGEQYSNEESSSFNISYTFINNDKLNLKGFAGYLRNQSDFYGIVFPRGVLQAIGLSDQPDAAFGGTVLLSNQTMGSMDAVYSFSEKHQLYFGASFRRAKLENVSLQNNWDAGALFNGGPFPIEFYSDVRETFGLGETGTREVLGIYLQDKIEFGKFKAIIGGRYDDYDDFGSTFNPRGALIYSPGKSKFKLMYGRAFRAPSQRERTNTDLTFVGNRDLDPETVQTIELAYIQQFSGGQFSLTYFDSTIDDGVQLVEFSQGGGTVAFQPQNVAEQDLSGFEFEGQFQLSDSFILRATATFFGDTEENPRQVAETLAAVILNYNHGRLNLNVNGYYHDEVQSSAIDEATGDFVTIDSFFKTNFAANYSLNDNFSINFRVLNAFDEDYYTVDNIIAFLPNGLPGRGRSYMGGLNLRF
ncbi:TonB-dependent receptor [Acanthopleuribacter pedis]